jgi:hypothetical protein
MKESELTFDLFDESHFGRSEIIQFFSVVVVVLTITDDDYSDIGFEFRLIQQTRNFPLKYDSGEQIEIKIQNLKFFCIHQINFVTLLTKKKT